MKSFPLKYATFISIAFLLARPIEASEFEKLGSAVAKALGTSAAFKKSVTLGGEEHSVFYSKNKQGGASRYAVVQKRIWEPACTHTWVVGIDAATSRVTDIRVVEMSCPHAFPCQKASFLEQYKGKGIPDIEKLDASVRTIAKATGSSLLTTDAVKKSLKLVKVIGSDKK